MPADLKRFRAVTTGKAIVMGRLTFASIGKALPDRLNIVLSRDPGLAARPEGKELRAAGCELATSLQAAVDVGARHHPEVMIIGGAAVYAEALPLADRILLTIVHDRFKGDAWFPALGSDWTISDQQPIPDEKLKATFFDLRRGGPPTFTWPTT